MFVGHEFLAFALVGGAARQFGRDDAAALRLGAVAALAALLPDLDVVYAVATYAVAVASGAPVGWEAFWGVANSVHRVVTHPLPVGAVATLVFGAVAALSVLRKPTGDARRENRSSRTGAFLLVTVASAALGVGALLMTFRAVAGTAAALVAAAFLVCVGAVAWGVGRRISILPSRLAAAAGVGFLTHPFGDVFLAVPPPLFSPFGPPLLTERVVFATDPTLEILAVLFVELATVWAGVFVLSQLSLSRFGRLREALDRRALLGVGYAAAAFVLPRPTVVDAHVLGFTIVPLATAVGLWVGRSLLTEPGTYTSPNRPRDRCSIADAAYRGSVSGLATLTVAATAYTVVYLLLPIR